MKPGYSRLVIELPDHIYHELEWLNVKEGSYKAAIVAKMVHARFQRVIKTTPSETERERDIEARVTGSKPLPRDSRLAGT